MGGSSNVWVPCGAADKIGEECYYRDTGETVTFSPYPTDPNLKVTSASGCDQWDSANNNCTVTVKSDRLVTFVLQKSQYNLTVINNSSVGGATISFNPTGITCGSVYPCQRYGAGTSVTVTLTPASGYMVQNMTGCDEDTGNTCTVTMYDHREVSFDIGAVSNPGTPKFAPNVVGMLGSDAAFALRQFDVLYYDCPAGDTRCTQESMVVKQAQIPGTEYYNRPLVCLSMAPNAGRSGMNNYAQGCREYLGY